MADVVLDSDNQNSKELYAQGVRAYVLQDYSTAVTALGKASEILVTEHGDDLHESLGEVYLYYGKALLGLSREESEALGDAVPRNNEESSEDEEMEENEEEDENADNETKETATEATSTNDEKEGTSSAEPTKSNEGTSNAISTDEPSSSNGISGAAPAETEDEPTDLQVAWEVLELAKKIFQKQGESSRKNLAETLTVLGEVSLESENFESAINDIKEGLEIQKQLFAKDSRTVAETFYKLGIAYSTDSRIDEAIKSFTSSLDYLKDRVANLEKLEDKKDEVDDEIKEITNLIPDIEEKINDMKTYKDKALQKIVSAVTEGTKAETPTTSSSSSKPATDISHLVKRKRKLEDVAEENQNKEADANPAKKANTK